MFSHVIVGANDVEASTQFYDAVLGALGIRPGRTDEGGRVLYMSEHCIFGIIEPINGEAASPANGGTIGFAASSPAAADAWHAAGLANGGFTCEEPPGVRKRPFGDLYLAYLRDPFGNKICALHRL